MVGAVGAPAALEPVGDVLALEVGTGADTVAVGGGIVELGIGSGASYVDRSIGIDIF